jgi:hypothetical protein
MYGSCLCNDTVLARKQKSYKITKTELFATLDKAKPTQEIQETKTLAAVMFTTVQMSGLPLWAEVLVSSRA